MQPNAFSTNSLKRLALLAIPLSAIVLALMFLRPAVIEHEEEASSSGRASSAEQTEMSAQPVEQASPPQPTEDKGKSESDPEIMLALGGTPRNEKCTVVERIIVTADGTQIAGKECVYQTEKPRHPYDDYSSETLQEMSYGDPYAALVLAKRVHETDPESAWGLMTRSAALLQDGTPLAWLAQMSYGRVATNDVPAISDIELYYVLSSMANRLPNGFKQPNLRMRGSTFYTMTDADVQRLELIVEQQVQRMEQIRREVTGESP